MSGNLLHVNATITCPHGGQATISPAQTRVLVGGQPVATLADVDTIAGCGFTVGSKPQPCVTVRWVTPSGRIRVNGSPAILNSSVGLCQSAEQIPQGAPHVVVVQQRAVGL
ncbi:hypothetical protein [Streptoalloteichus hindustanus]|uniref:DUF4280 domain-containing protein n=1 Tax=Streptoalloteichus hindustanus TaxID=2017 RepID=A0A1M4YVP5_STRHI|nr:hypothetical protein [Streptoalloteichus hindustanus]SHF09863.1 hypothetical protein SAMN05444320_102504 [Streptoalloteichus hindustanus]